MKPKKQADVEGDINCSSKMHLEFGHKQTGIQAFSFLRVNKSCNFTNNCFFQTIQNKYPNSVYGVLGLEIHGHYAFKYRDTLIKITR